jgi:nucleoside-diphosphate-sugar epimerase
MKVVLAGGAGMLGRRTAADLARRGDEIVILIRRPRPDGLWLRDNHDRVPRSVQGKQAS